VDLIVSTQRRARLPGRLPPAPAATRDMHNDMHDELTGRPDDPMLRRQPASRRGRCHMFHVLGIDAGGTKTVCLLADEAGRVLASSRGGGANLKTVGELAVEKVLHTVMDAVLSHSDVPPAAICLGIAGADRESDGHTMRAIVRRMALKTRTLVVNDALVALVAGAGDGPGIVIVAGTGSIVYGRDGRNRAARAGGWGNVLGDEGSGYWIGRKALAAVMRHADGRGRPTALTPRILRHFGLTRPSDLLPLVYDRGIPLHEIAALGGLVSAARADGDEEAALILRSAADELLAAARSVVWRLDMAEAVFPFVLSGGMFAGVPWLAEEVTRGLSDLAPRAVVKRLVLEPAIGAVHLAIAEATGGARVPDYV
jgi:N-acetylglucosamine kinase-like BadF-type ATPase